MGTGRIALTWIDGTGTTRVWTFEDAIVADTATQVATATSYPVESGLKVTDHVRPEPTELAVDVLVAGSPIVVDGYTTETLPLVIPKPPVDTPGRLLDAGVAAIASAFGNPSSDPSSFVTNRPPKGRDFVRETYEILELIQGRRGEPPALLEVTSTIRTWPGLYVLTRWSPSRTVAEGDGAAVSMEFREVRFAYLKEVPTPKPTAIRANKKKSKGKQDPVPPTDARKQSMLKSLIRGGSGG